MAKKQQLDAEPCPKCGNPGLSYYTIDGRAIFYCGSPCGTLFKDGKIETDPGDF